MKKLITLITILAFILSAVAVYAGLTAPGYDQKPLQGTVLTSTSVNFSVRINNTNDGNTTFRLLIYNTSSSTKNFSASILAAPLINETINNGSFWNKTVTMTDALRHYWYASFPNSSSSGVILNTSTSTFNIDTIYYKLIFGSQNKFNVTLDTGQVDTDFGVRFGPAGSDEICNAATRGLISYNITQGFIGCTADGWKAINGTVV